MTVSEDRFPFGANWRRFLSVLDEERIERAKEGVAQMIGLRDLDAINFLDAGSGSGLSSLVARRMGASVYSFDVDADSVACTRELRTRYFPDDDHWQVEQGSVLDSGYLDSLGKLEVVYSWGVLHHTGAMWRSLDNITTCVAPGGVLCVAIYNDQGWVSQYWRYVKRLFNRGSLTRALAIAVHTPYLIGGRLLVRAFRGALQLERGMSFWHDMLDWLGGYPFEVATPESIISFFEQRGFVLTWKRTCGRRHGCNEFAFRHA